MSKTCECGHGEYAHMGARMCVSPDMCSCNKFVEAKPVPASPKRFAEMTGEELWDWFSDNGRGTYDAIAALRDAILAERDAEHEAVIAAGREKGMKIQAALDLDASASIAVVIARIAELRADLTRSRDAHNAAIRERDYARLVCDGSESMIKDLAAQLRTAESALGEARREGAREALEKVARHLGSNTSNTAVLRVRGGDTGLAFEIAEKFRDREYPATPTETPDA